MSWLKVCPFCLGDLYLEEDVFGSYLVCFRCGHDLNMIEELNLDDPWSKVVGDDVEAVPVLGEKSN
jgi:hypothetical protein